ncbi:MAG: hypothetical protein KGL39_11365 [Patescibacteria group bacterium]|nr:hypothetical protein [Patescibacteria group bacterium]
MELNLSGTQLSAIEKRFKATVDVAQEMENARQYLAIHRGRPYSNLGRFFWNWCLRAEKWDRGGGRKAPGRRPAWRAELESLCTKCGRLRTAAMAPNRGTATVCGWCGNVEAS